MAEDVWSAASDNTYQAVTTNNASVDASTNDTHTRIYEYIHTTIELDEMSLPLIDDIDSNSDINPSTGLHVDSSNNINENVFETLGNKSPDKSMSIGATYPLLRINDHYYTQTDIKYFSLSCSGLIPLIEVILSCHFNDILKENTIKDGDICSVFLNPNHDTIKSYRGDFLINESRTKDMKQNKYENTVEIHFLAELFIPTIYDGSATFSYSGTSRDALIDVALKLGLGFFFSDPENTEDVLMWYCTADGDLKETGEAPIIQYIKDTAAHAYKNFESFFDCWIDPRYAITFINVALMLGGSGLDEEIDLAIFNTAMSLSQGIEGKNQEATAKEKASKVFPMPKLLNNVVDGKMGITAFAVRSYKELSDNNASKTLGMTNNNYYSLNNSGITSVAEGEISMEYSIPVNADKLKNGFYIMAGPGKNLTYTQADTGSYPDLHKSVQGGQLADTQSDGDDQELLNSGNNMLSSGNTGKFYDCGELHNLLNNSWLKKKYISVVLNGLNMQMMRGEKIPMMLFDRHNPMQNYMGTKNDIDSLYKRLVPNCCGWFIISSIKWIYDRLNVHDGTLWETHLELTRREWPIPGYKSNGGSEKESEIVVENNTQTGTTNDSLNSSTNSSAGSNSSTGESSSSSSEMTTEGLKDFMILIYNDIKEVASANNGAIKLVSARRWAADENGNRIEGEPTVQNGDTWKFVNAKGDVMWFTSKTSRHLYGEAIDIINGEGTSFEDIAKYICTSYKTLSDMLTNKVYLAKEISEDDTGALIEHYHLGTVDKNNSNDVNTLKNFWNALIEKFGTYTFTYNNKTYNMQQYV